MTPNPGLGRRGEVYVALQLFLFTLIFFVPLLIPSLLDWPSPLASTGFVVGVILIAAGGLLAVAGVLSLGRNLTAVPYPKEDAVLIENGAYRLVRHPIYSGIIIGATGWALFHNSLLTLLLSVALFILFDAKSRREEKWLCEKYEGYPAYQARVRKLIPLIY